MTLTVQLELAAAVSLVVYRYSIRAEPSCGYQSPVALSLILPAARRPSLCGSGQEPA